MHFDLAGLQSQSDELEKEQHAEGFWEDMAKAQSVNKKLKQMQDKIKYYASIKNIIDDSLCLIELCDEAGETDDASELPSVIATLQKQIDAFRLQTLFRGKYDANNAIMTLHAGAGGTEAQDWTSMLYRMYSRYLERKGFSQTVLDTLDGDEAGLKSITFLVEGDNAYGYLRAEKGVHRLVRISPFDSNARRHTSFASLEVMPEIEADGEYVINMDEVRIDTYRSGGAGGQHVNKTDSAVRMTHLPTGIVVQCQNERSQIQNRERAMRMLKGKLIEHKEREQQEKEQEMKGNLKKIEWGSQIRSYVFCPYTMVKDHRTGFETGNIDGVMDGDIEDFITEYLKKA